MSGRWITSYLQGNVEVLSAISEFQRETKTSWPLFPFSRNQNFIKQFLFVSNVSTAKLHAEDYEKMVKITNKRKYCLVGAVWPTERPYLIVFVKVCAATLFVRHAFKATKNITRETFTAFNTGWFTLWGAGQVVAGCWTCRHARAVLAVGRTWHTCKNKESSYPRLLCVTSLQNSLSDPLCRRQYDKYTHTDVHAYIIALKL